MSLLARQLPHLSRALRANGRHIALYSSSRVGFNEVKPPIPSSNGNREATSSKGLPKTDARDSEIEEEKDVNYRVHFTETEWDEGQPIFNEPNFYSVPDPVFDNSETHDLGTPLGSTVVNSNWKPMFMNFDEIDEFQPSLEEPEEPDTFLSELDEMAAKGEDVSGYRIENQDGTFTYEEFKEYLAKQAEKSRAYDQEFKLWQYENDPEGMRLAEELAARPARASLPPDFDPEEIEKYVNLDDLDDKQISGPLHNLPIPYTELDELHCYPLLNLFRSHQSGKGKIASRYCMLVVGNGNGLVGLGEGKAEEPRQAYDFAYAQAIRSMDYVDRFEGRTLWTEMETKFGSTRLVMRPRPVGFGLMCAPGIHQVFKAAGIKDASVKIWGSRNKVIVPKVAIKMLHASSQPLGLGNGIGGRGRRLEKGVGMRNKQAIERERGRRIIDSRTW